MKKHLIIALFLCLGFTAAQAQVDVKLDPVSALFGNIKAGADFQFKDNFGLDATVVYAFDKDEIGDVKLKSSRIGGILMPKYYFSPSKGTDRFWVALYAKYIAGKYEDSEDEGYTSTRFAVGPAFGYKWVSRNNIVFELGMGVGRAFVNEVEINGDNYDFDEVEVLNIDFLFRMGLGYRFGGSK